MDLPESYQEESVKEQSDVKGFIQELKVERFDGSDAPGCRVVLSLGPNPGSTISYRAEAFGEFPSIIADGISGVGDLNNVVIEVLRSGVDVLMMNALMLAYLNQKEVTLEFGGGFGGPKLSSVRF